MDETKIETISVKLNWGVTAETYAGMDDAGNKRIFCKNGVSLEEWRNDANLVPPWLLPRDFTDPKDWDRLMKKLESIKKEAFGT